MKPGQLPSRVAAVGARQQFGQRVGALAMRSSSVPAAPGPMPGSSCSTRKPATRSRGLSTKRSSASTSLMWALSRNLSPPILHERDVAAGELDLELGGMARRAEQHRLLLQASCRLRGSSARCSTT